MAGRPISPAQPFISTKTHTPIQPNAHPYAIKTTSSGLLSRSNSSPHSAQHTKHHYVPSSPTRPRHRHSSSLSSVDSVGGNEVNLPAPLPTPPSSSALPTRSSSHSADDTTPRRRTRRAETLPGGTTNPITDLVNGANLYGDLPSNPRQWNTDELATYLSSSLRETSILDDLGVEGVLDFIRERGFTGRELLKLTDADLASTPLSDLQRARLLENSGTLRANVLRGRIYLDPSHPNEISDHANDVYTHSVKSSPFHGNLYRLSVSSVDLLSPSFSDLNGDLPQSPVMSIRRSNAMLEASAQRYRDLTRLRTRHRGKVRDLVEKWQRGSRQASTSGSESSMSEDSVTDSDSESERNVDEESGLVLHDESSSPLKPSSSAIMAGSTIIPPPPYSSPTLEVEEELSMEELLVSSAPLQGARAWEADIGLGETVKHVSNASVSPDPPPSQPTASHDTSKAVISKHSIPSKGSRGGTGSSGNARSRKRVVTAIFTGSPPTHEMELSDEVPEIAEVSDLVDPSSGDTSRIELIGTETQCREAFPAVSRSVGPSADVFCGLENSLAATRSQLESFRVRLEAVEAETARHQAELLRAPQFILRDSTSHDGSTTSTNVETEGTSPHDEIKREPSIDGPLGFNFSLRDITGSIVAKVMGWAFPYSHTGLHTRPEQPRAHRSRDDGRSPARRPPLPALRVSFIIWFSFAICAAILRKAVFGRWVRKP
ncbi:hypothetical protein BU15DRAFT_82480 [Melanogaster broomeanus]|nr:hypothetical protein BU15DRAFT_82480 [Melanogaster broomeanus]